MPGFLEALLLWGLSALLCAYGLLLWLPLATPTRRAAMRQRYRHPFHRFTHIGMAASTLACGLVVPPVYPETKYTGLAVFYCMITYFTCLIFRYLPWPYGPLRLASASFPFVDAPAADAAPAFAYAGIRRRLAAWLTDHVLVGLPAVFFAAPIAMILPRVSELPGQLLYAGLMVVYQSLAITCYGQTFGAHLWRIAVVDCDGNRLPPENAALRALPPNALAAASLFMGAGGPLLQLLVGAGYLSVFFYPTRQTVWDMLAGCVVVRTVSAPEEPEARTEAEPVPALLTPA